jgi:CDP-paratose 2-epimerase
MNNCLITGGAGFIGTNLAEKLIRENKKVRIFDNLSRRGVEKNLKWLKDTYPGKFEFIEADIRDFEAVKKAVRGIDTIFHYASQVAVTTSVTDPRTDFEINAMGTLNLLEAARIMGEKPSVLFTSTNKVYGKLQSLGVVETKKRYDFKTKPEGVDESQNLDFYSPYGCSKGTGDQYVHDYSRIFGLKTVVFRMSCIYGPHQFGNEDQGWVIHFVISALLNRTINIFGDGKQVRDILYVEDLINAFYKAAENTDKSGGKIFNIGGGKINSVSLIELMEILEEITGRKIPTNHFDWRPGDQKVYISNIKKAEETFNWKPQKSSEEGVRLLTEWVKMNRELFK